MKRKHAFIDHFKRSYGASNGHDGDSDQALDSRHTGHFFSLFTTDIDTSTSNTTQQEIDRFFALPPELYRNCPDPVKWWATHQSEFPRLAQMARDILSIPGELTLT
jgi:hypothetical protein